MHRLTYRDAVKILGTGNSPVVAALDKVLGGLLLGTTLVSADAPSVFDAKFELSRLANELVAGWLDRCRKLSQFDRVQRRRAARVSCWSPPTPRRSAARRQARIDLPSSPATRRPASRSGPSARARSPSCRSIHAHPVRDGHPARHHHGDVLPLGLLDLLRAGQAKLTKTELHERLLVRFAQREVAKREGADVEHELLVLSIVALGMFNRPATTTSTERLATCTANVVLILMALVSELPLVDLFPDDPIDKWSRQAKLGKSQLTADELHGMSRLYSVDAARMLSAATALVDHRLLVAVGALQHPDSAHSLRQSWDTRCAKTRVRKLSHFE
ncbi:hypothetical protein [Actinokineospora cianjurensis]|uniref:NACHT N-terminal helical domain 7-containing protein n=1 Tax=Actinokineospora cianjurensis TaxID=585224 RepID=UPI000EB55EAF|nr:hypothetical protein [Actinokineospora cianjurensis]